MKTYISKLRRFVSAVRSAEWAMPKTQYAWILFEFLLLFIGFLFVGVCALSLIAIVSLLIALAPLPDSTTAIFVYVCSLAAAFRLIWRDAAEIVEGALGILNDLTLRLISVVVIGWSETTGQTNVGLWARYIGLFLVTTFLAVLYCRYQFQSDLPRLGDLTSWKSASGNVDVRPAIWLSTKFAFAIYFLTLPIRLLYSQPWNSLLQRGKFERSHTMVLGPLGGATQATLAVAGSHLVSHLSDLHVGGGAKTLGQQATLLNHTSRLASIFDVVALDKPAAVVVSGDITDSGSQEQWDAFLAATSGSAVVDKMVLAPGNHDLNIVFEGIETVTKFEELNRRGDNERAVSYLDAADHIMGDRAQVICPFTGVRSTLRAALERSRKDIDHKMNRTGPRDIVAPVDLLERLFPMAVTVDGGLVVMVWNSVKRNRWPVFNAIGRIGDAQIARATKLAEGLDVSTPLLHVTHHQLSVPPRSDCKFKQGGLKWAWFFGAWMSLEDPMALLNWLRKRRQASVLLHGHHHKFFLRKATNDDLTLVSAPSATVGCEESYDTACEAGKRGKWLDVEIVTRGPDAAINLVRVREVT